MRTLLALPLLAAGATAQVAPLLVTDSTADTVWRCADLNADDDFNDAGEVATFYSDALGQVPFQNNVGIRNGPDGAVFVCDTSEDSVFLLRDYDGDGDGHEDGENVRWLDGRAGGNASGVLLPSPNSLIVGSDSVVWIANANSGTVGFDSIVRARDLNFDGDANDAGEAFEYWTYPGSPGGDSLPQAVGIGLDGNLYVTDAPSSGPNGKGVYRLVDLTADGDALDPGETTAFFIPPFTATPFFWCLELAPDGWWYTADTGNEVVWRFRDLNGDGDAHDSGESSAWWTVGAASTIWDVTAAADGSVYVTDSQPTQRLLRLYDADASGAIGPGEAVVVYDEALAVVVIGNGRGIDLVRPGPAGTAVCFGDGTGTACPCGNSGTSGKGCANSIFTGGARLETQGVASIASDTLVLVGSRMPSSSALYFQGTSTLGGGLGVAFGDGLRCAGGALIRLGTKINVAGLSHYPEGGDLSVSVRGLVVSGTQYAYQVWYRNADPAFCTASTFNLSNAVVVTW